MREPLKYDAGIYAITSKRTGDRYVGASCFLSHRLATHVAGILNGGRRNSPLRSAFAGHAEEEIELRILERVVVLRDPKARTWHYDRRAEPGRAVLMERERFWIRKLRPSLNKNKTLPDIGVHMPVLEPEIGVSQFVGAK